MKKVPVNDSLNLDDLPYIAIEVNDQRIITAVNKLAEDFGVKVGTHCWDTFGKRASISKAAKEYFEEHNCVPEGGIKCFFCMADEALEKQEHIVKNILIGNDIWETHWIPTAKDKYIHYGIKISSDK